MKKFLLILLALTMCVSMCACGESQENTSEASNQSEDPQIETVDIDALLNSLDNQAKAELNIGKKTTMFVRVGTVYSEYCEVIHQLYKRESIVSKVCFPKEVLASFYEGKFLTVSAIVSDVDADGDVFSYVFKDANIDDMSLFDEYVREKFSLFDRDTILFSYDDFLADYLYRSAFRGNYFEMENDAEIENYVIGKWLYPDTVFTDLAHPEYGKKKITQTCTYHANGSVDWWGNCTEWSIKDGHLFTFNVHPDGTSVYKITDDVMYLFDVHVRE